MGVVKIRVQQKSPLEMRDGFVIPSGQNEIKAGIGTDDRRKRIQLFGPPGCNDGFVRSLRKRQNVTQPVIRGRVVWFEFDGAVKLLFRGGLIPGVSAKVEPECGVWFRK